MTVNGVYGYVVTETYPYILACFTGTLGPSFRKPGPDQRGQSGARGPARRRN